MVRIAEEMYLQEQKTELHFHLFFFINFRNLSAPRFKNIDR